MISAVIPTYNRAALVERAVESVLAQSVPSVEIVVVDDGSQDDTAERLARFDTQVRYIFQDNAGSAVARNTGLAHAKCDWVALLDSDDVWHPQHLERMTQAIEGTEGSANYYFADTLEPAEKGRGMLWEKLNFEPHGAYERVDDGTDWVLMRPRQPMMLQSTVLNRKRALEAGGFIKELRYRDDTHLFLKLGLGQPICAVNGCGAIMTSDDVDENRLTLTHDGTVMGTRMQVIMFADLLQSPLPLADDTRADLVSRLSAAHRNMARHALANQQYGEVLRELFLSARVDPSGLLQHLFRKGSSEQ